MSSKALLGILAIGVVGAVVILSGADKRYPSVDDTTAMMSARSDCRERGVAYYKEIESFPYLSSGRSAIDVITEKCRASSTAF
jgi:hypothetical protein